MVRDGIRQKGRWPGERKSLRAYLRDELSARSENSPSDSMISAMLNRTAPQVLQDERARGTDLVQLTDRLAGHPAAARRRPVHPGCRCDPDGMQT